MQGETDTRSLVEVDSSSATAHRATRVILLFYSTLLGPLFISALALPFGWWDWLSLPSVGFRGAIPNSIIALPRLYEYDLLQHTMHFRPNYYLTMAISYMVLGGEFWAWYVAKWGIYVLSSLFAWQILERLGVNTWARLAAVAFLLFHPCRPELMLLSTDGWSAFATMALGLVVVRTTICDGHLLDLGRLRWPHYLAVLALFWYAAWMKEISIVFAIVLLACYAIRASARARSQLLLVPFALIVAVAGWRLFVLQRLAVYGTVNTSGDVSAKLGSALSLAAGLGASVPVAAVLVAWALVVIGTVLYARRCGSGQRAVVVVFLLSAVGTAAFLAFSSRPIAPRYTVPIAALAAIPLGVALNSLPRRGRFLGLAFALLFPMVTLTDIYGQYLAYQHRFYEETDMLALIEDKLSAGCIPAVSGADESVPGRGSTLELQGTVQSYFGEYRGRLYEPSAAPVEVLNLKSTGVPRSPFVLVSTLTPDRVLGGAVTGLEVSRLQAIYYIRHSRLGLVEYVYSWLAWRDQLLHIARSPTYDVGPTVLSYTPSWFLYEVGSSPAVRSATELNSKASHVKVIGLAPRLRWGAIAR